MNFAPIRSTLHFIGATTLLMAPGFSYAYTDGDWSFSCSGDTATISGYSGSSAVVTIPSTVTRTEEYREQDDDGEWHTRYRYYHHTVTAIGGSVFKNKSSLTHATIPSSVASIGSYLFSGCTSLRTLEMPSVTIINSYALSDCTNLTSCVLNEGITYVGDEAFYHSFRASFSPDGTLSLPNVTTIGREAFWNCNGIKDLRVGSKLTHLGDYAFSCCYWMTNVVMDADGISLPSFLFSECTRLESATFGDGITGIAGGTYSPSAFRGCNNLKRVSFGSGLTTLSGGAFSGLYSLRTLEMPYVTSIGAYAVRDCTNLTSCVLNEGITYVGDEAFYHSFRASFSPDGTLSLPNVTTIGREAFWNCNGIKDLRVGSKLETLGTSAFQYCYWMTNAVVDANGQGQTFPASTFDTCIRLKSVEIGDGFSGVGSSTFTTCTNLVSATFGANIVSIPSECFKGLKSLRSFKSRANIQSVGSSAFYGCIGCQFGHLSLPALQSTGTYAFWNCNGITELELPACYTSPGDRTFQACHFLTNIVMKNGFSTIPTGFFSYCSRLKEVTIPASVTRIGSEAFRYDSSLTNVWLKGSPPAAGSYVFSDVANGARGHYPRSLASEWLPPSGPIDRNGKWNGLIMHELSQPVLRVKSASPAEGSITLAWDDGTDGQCVSSYAIYRGPGPERLPEYFVEGDISDTEWTDHGYWNAEPVLSPLNYWVVAESDYFDLPESNRVETRHRYGLSVGFDKYGTLNRGLRQSLADAILFSNLVSRGKAERVDLIKNEGAKRSDIHDAFIRWSTIVKPGDTFFFFIATHGGYNGAAAGLSAYDGTYSVSQLVSDSSLISSEASFAGVIMSCHSRALVDSTDDTNFTFKVRSGLAQCRPNSAWIASCGYDESSFNTPTSRQTLFGEWFLEEGWQNGYADTELYGMEYGGVHSDGSLTLLELARYARAFAKGLSDAKPSTVFWNEESEPVMSRLVLDTTCSPAELSPPTAPTGLTAERHALRSIALSWNAVQGAKLYRVHRNPAGEPNEWACIRNHCPSPSYIDDTGLALSQSYFYRLQAVNPVGVSEMSAPAFGSAGALDFLGFLAAGAPDIVSASTPTPDQYETAAASVGLNGVSLEYSFIAGLDPKDPNARFESRIDMVDGEPVVTPFPDLGTNRVYTVEGRTSLSNTNEVWHAPDENSRFFRVKVALPE